MRGLQPGPINTFPKWKELGRFVKRGERALTTKYLTYSALTVIMRRNIIPAIHYSVRPSLADDQAVHAQNFTA